MVEVGELCVCAYRGWTDGQGPHIPWSWDVGSHCSPPQEQYLIKPRTISLALQSSLTEHLSLFPGCEIAKIHGLDFSNRKKKKPSVIGPHL